MELTADEVLQRMTRNLPFYKSGGLTVTGGEPLLQIDFLIELFTKAKAQNIHTALDTSGVLFERGDAYILKKMEKLASVCDLVMLDIKHMDEDSHKKLTGRTNKNIIDFARFLDKLGARLRIRQVIIPEITDSESQLLALGAFTKTLQNLEKIELLPYHDMGRVKYESLGMAYPLEGVTSIVEANWTAFLNSFAPPFSHFTAVMLATLLPFTVTVELPAVKVTVPSAKSPDGGL
jgi:pyruvate formate lyase activating enzyme